MREDIIGDGFDMMIMRELTGGLYFGSRVTEERDGVLTLSAKAESVLKFYLFSFSTASSGFSTIAIADLNKAGEAFGHTFSYDEILMGGVSIDATGVPLTEEAIAQAKASDAVLMGSIGGNTSTSPWYQLPPQLRPEAGLLKLRKSLNLFANLRPAYLYQRFAILRISFSLYVSVSSAVNTPSRSSVTLLPKYKPPVASMTQSLACMNRAAVPRQILQEKELQIP